MHPPPMRASSATRFWPSAADTLYRGLNRSVKPTEASQESDLAGRGCGSRAVRASAPHNCNFDEMHCSLQGEATGQKMGGGT